VNVDGRTLAVDAAGTTVFALTTSGLSITTLDPPNIQDRPIAPANGIVNLSSYLPNIAPGGLVSIYGRNLGNLEVASGYPLPYTLGGVCVTLNNAPIPLFMTSPEQINVEIPPEAATGRYSLVIRNVEKKAASNQTNITVAKYAPAIFVDPTTKEALVFHSDGRRVSKDHPAKRDEPLVLYATGLGPTKGGKVTSGLPSPSNPLAVSDPVELFFGDERYKQAGIIVDWSGLAPGFVGLYQLNIRVPGDHMRGDDLPVTLKIGTATSQKTGAAVPIIAVD